MGARGRKRRRDGLRSRAIENELDAAATITPADVDDAVRTLKARVPDAAPAVDAVISDQRLEELTAVARAFTDTAYDLASRQGRELFKRDLRALRAAYPSQREFDRIILTSNAMLREMNRERRAQLAELEAQENGAAASQRPAEPSSPSDE